MNRLDSVFTDPGATATLPAVRFPATPPAPLPRHPQHPQHAQGPDRVALLAAARAMAPRIRAVRDEIEDRRRLPLPLVRAMARAGLFQLLRPRALGGLETDPLTFLALIEEVARADASAAWLLMTNNGGLVAAWLSDRAGRTIYEADPDAVVGGTLVPRGQALPVEGGYRISGRWPFASGVQHCAWMAVACVVVDGAGQPLPGPLGRPQVRACFVPAPACTVLDTWSVGGLRGTGSHDILIEGHVVPEELTCTLDAPPDRPGPLYAFPAWGLGAAAMATVCLGAARGAVDALVALAGGAGPAGAAETPPPGGRAGPPLGERPLLHAQLAQAEAHLGGARAFLLETVGEVWGTVCAGRTPSPQQRVRLRLAATHAGDGAVRAVDLANTAAGSAALYTRNPIERAFRDVHAAVHHFNLQPWTYEAAGRAILGLPPAGPPL